MPEPCESFDKLSSDCKLHSRIIENIKSVGYVTPTPIQIQAIPVMLHVSMSAYLFSQDYFFTIFIKRGQYQKIYRTYF